MPTPTYVPLATLTLSSADGSITFSSIPATYRDLILLHSVKHTFAGSISVRDTGVRFNGDTGSNYSEVLMYGTGSSTASNSATRSSIQLVYGMASSNFQLGVMQIMDYSATDKHKSVLYRTGAGNDDNYGTFAGAFRWANTAAVTSLSITPSGSYEVIAGSTFSLYGVN